MNKSALELLKIGKKKESLAKLKGCEQEIVRKLKKKEKSNSWLLKLLSITLNNLACYCKS